MQPANKPNKPRKPSKANKAQKAQRSRHLSVRLRPGSKEMLEFISARDARSLSWLVEEAVREYVTKLLPAEQIAEITEAAVSANMPTNSFSNTSHDEDIEEPDNYAPISAVTIPVIPAHIDVAEAVEAGQVAEIPEAIVRPEGHTQKMSEDLIPFTVPSLPDLPPPAFMG